MRSADLLTVTPRPGAQLLPLPRISVTACAFAAKGTARLIQGGKKSFLTQPFHSSVAYLRLHLLWTSECRNLAEYCIALINNLCLSRFQTCPSSNTTLEFHRSPGESFRASGRCWLHSYKARQWLTRHCGLSFLQNMRLLWLGVQSLLMRDRLVHLFQFQTFFSSYRGEDS